MVSLLLFMYLIYVSICYTVLRHLLYIFSISLFLFLLFLFLLSSLSSPFRSICCDNKFSSWSARPLIALVWHSNSPYGCMRALRTGSTRTQQKKNGTTVVSVFLVTLLLLSYSFILHIPMYIVFYIYRRAALALPFFFKTLSFDKNFSV